MWGAHFMAVESFRASRTNGDMDVGGCRQKLLKMFPGEERRGVSATGLPSAWVRLCGWPSQWRELWDGMSGRGPHYLVPVQSGNWPQ